MSLARLVLRSLAFYWRTNLAVAFGLGVATAVITGSLVVGDSVRASLRDTALGRIGRIDAAVVSARQFRAALATDLAKDPAVAAAFEAISPILQTQGAARQVETQAVVPSVTVLGVDNTFGWFFDDPASFALAGRECLVSWALAHDLQLAPGQSLLLSVRRQSAIPTDSLFARRALKDTAPSLRVQVKTVLPAGGAGDFRLDAQSSAPRNVFVSRAWLEARLDAAGKANVLVAAQKPGATDAASALKEGLARACTPTDYGLRLGANGALNQLSLGTDATLLSATQLTAARQAAKDCGAQSARVSVYLATQIQRVGLSAPMASPPVPAPPRDKGIAYAMLAGVEPVRGVATQVGMPGEGQIWLNDWAAADLKAAVGDLLDISYLVPTNDGTYPAGGVRLRLTKIVPLAGAAADPSLVPAFKGITDTKRVSDWKPPFPVDLSRVTPRDEEYWQKYRATPKGFVSLATLRSLWQQGPDGTRADWVTSVRVFPRPGVRLADLAAAYRTRLQQLLTPEAMGIAVQPLRERALVASEGTSDFGQLFLGLSMFLVFSGIGLAGTLMRLSLDGRTAQAGVMLASGISGGKVWRALVAEGAVLTALGAVAGVPLGVGYASGIIYALGTWWSGAIGMTPSLWLHVDGASLGIGAASGFVAGLLTVTWSARSLRRRPALELLAGQLALNVTPARARAIVARIVAVLSLLGGVALLVLSAGTGTVASEGAFFGVGCCLLVGGLAGARVLLARTLRATEGWLSTRRLIVRNAAASGARSLLVVGLLASAAFVIVAVAANTRDLSRADVTRKDSGSGGFALMATSSIPLPYDLSTPAGRGNLGFEPEDEAAFAGVEFVSLLASPGEDISCLNLAKPGAPRILGVPTAMIDHDGFTVTTESGSAQPWRLLDPAPGAQGAAIPVFGAIAAFGDADSVEWNLHSGLGKIYRIPDASGNPVDLQFVGLVRKSIFARELLVGEKAFRRLFPTVTRPSVFLLAVPPGREQAVAEVLRQRLGDVGVEVRSTRELLNEFLAVQNTYLSVFLALGGLGLALGTIGVVIALFRGALERRGELALMSAVGFGKVKVVGLLLWENGGLILAGLALGTASALAAVWPETASAESGVNWGALCVVLGAIVVIGLAACTVAVVAALRGNLIASLRRE